MSSVRRYLVLVLLAIIILVIFFAAIQSYRNTISASALLFDRQLKSVADALNSLPLNQQNSRHKDTLMVDIGSEFIFQIWHQDRLLLATEGIDTTPFTDFNPGVREENIANARWQTLAHYYPQTKHWVMVAEPLHHRVELSEEMILATLTPLVLSLPVLAILISMAVKQGLSPLHQLTDELEMKKADDLGRLSIPFLPDELKPVVSTINSLLQRLEQAFSRERRFASDAAHELRTPLSVLKLNAHNLEKELGSSSRNVTLLKEGVERMSHLVDQILLLNRTNPEHFRVQFETVDVHRVSQQVITDLYPQIAAKEQHISLQGQASEMLGDVFSLKLLLQNLLSNASKYSPPKSVIEVTVAGDTQSIELIVEDSGPGLEEQEYERVFDRFYRVGGDRHQSGVPGCGLGLAIVQHILTLYDGSIDLSRSETLGGLKVSVCFPTRKSA